LAAALSRYAGIAVNMASASPSPPEVDENAADMPLTMAASVVLDQLPRDAHKALETAGELEQEKGKALILLCNISFAKRKMLT